MADANKPKKSDANRPNKIFKVIVGIAGITAMMFAGVTIYQDSMGQQISVAANATMAAIEYSQATLQAEIVNALATGNVSNLTAVAIQSTYGALEAEKAAVFATFTPGYQPQVVTERPPSAHPTLMPTTTEVALSSPNTPTDALPTGEKIVLANSEDNTFTWINGSPYVSTKFLFEGDVGFISTGNNYFNEDLGVVGYESNEVRYITFQLFLLEQDAALLLQVNTAKGGWEHRWGFDGRTSYKGEINKNRPRQGNSLNLPVGEWIGVKLDLIDDLRLKPGEKVLGLGFAGNDGNIVYDRVVLMSSEEE